MKIQKYHLYDPANSWKTCKLNSITTIFDAFTNPPGSEDIFISDSQVVTRYDILAEVYKSLRVSNVHLIAHKPHFAEDIDICIDESVFLTSISAIPFVGCSSNIEGKNTMMDAHCENVSPYLSNSCFLTKKYNI